MKRGKRGFKIGATSQGSGIGRAVGIGIGVSAALTLGLTALLALLVDRQVMTPETAAKFPAAICVVSALAGAWIAAGQAGKKRLPVCLLTGGGYLLVLLAVTAFAFAGSYTGIPLRLALVLGTCCAAGLLGASGKGNGMKRYKSAIPRGR